MLRKNVADTLPTEIKQGIILKKIPNLVFTYRYEHAIPLTARLIWTGEMIFIQKNGERFWDFLLVLSILSALFTECLVKHTCMMGSMHFVIRSHKLMLILRAWKFSVFKSIRYLTQWYSIYQSMQLSFFCFFEKTVSFTTRNFHPRYVCSGSLAISVSSWWTHTKVAYIYIYSSYNVYILYSTIHSQSVCRPILETVKLHRHNKNCSNAPDIEVVTVAIIIIIISLEPSLLCTDLWHLSEDWSGGSPHFICVGNIWQHAMIHCHLFWLSSWSLSSSTHWPMKASSFFY